MNANLIRLQGLQSKFRDMELEGEIDPKVARNVTELEEGIREDGKRLIEELGRLDRFKTYFAVKTQILILEDMKNRIKNPRNKEDNPKVAKDSIAVLDSMQEFCKLTPSKIRDLDFTDFLQLQKKARFLDMFPDSDELKRTFSYDKIKSANRFFDNLRNRIEV